MFDIITKADYWSYMDQGFVKPSVKNLKNCQDGYALDRLKDVSGARILEIGGGESRVLDALAANGNECWNADDFGGSGNGPVTMPKRADYKIVPVLLGDFSTELPDNYFDFVFSISVVEHIPWSGLGPCFADACRVLKPGGVMFHAIDLYLYDDHETAHATNQVARIQSYLDIANNLPLTWQSPPEVDANVTFRTGYAANSDEQLYTWSVALPDMRDIRASAQNCSLKSEWARTDATFDWSAFVKSEA